MRLLIKTIARQVLRIKSWIYEAARNLYRGRRAVLLQMFTTRHSNRKLSIVMSLSTTFTQYAPDITKFGKITQNKGHFAVQGHSGHRFWYQHSEVENRYISPPLMRLKPRRISSSGTISVKFSVDVIGWPRYQTAKKNCRKSQLAE